MNEFDFEGDLSFDVDSDVDSLTFFNDELDFSPELGSTEYDDLYAA